MEMPTFEPGMSGSEVIDLASDVMRAYGDLAKGFVAAMIQKTALDVDATTRDLWLAVADVVWAIDPDASAGCPAHLASQIRLH